MVLGTHSYSILYKKEAHRQAVTRALYNAYYFLLSETNISILETTRSCRLVCHPARREESLCRARRASGAEILRGAKDDITLPVLVVQVHYHGFAIVYKETSFRTQPIRKEHHRSC